MSTILRVHILKVGCIRRFPSLACCPLSPFGHPAKEFLSTEAHKRPIHAAMPLSYKQWAPTSASSLTDRSSGTIRDSSVGRSAAETNQARQKFKEKEAKLDKGLSDIETELSLYQYTLQPSELPPAGDSAEASRDNTSTSGLTRVMEKTVAKVWHSKTPEERQKAKLQKIKDRLEERHTKLSEQLGSLRRIEEARLLLEQQKQINR